MLAENLSLAAINLLAAVILLRVGSSSTRADLCALAAGVVGVCAAHLVGAPHGLVPTTAGCVAVGALLVRATAA